MKSFKEYNELNEKLIILNNGKKYGQIVFLAGGAGSGKGFALTNFMQSDLFKVRDVDEWKLAFLKIADAKNKYPEIKGLDLKTPADVGKLHAFLDKKGIKSRTMNLLLGGMKKETLPNIVFDITAKDVKSIQKLMPDLLRAGYNPANVHMVWVLTDYQVAIKNNAGRERVVPSDIMLQTHEGAANTMFKLISGIGQKLAVNGDIHVILNNRKNTIMWKKGDTAKGGQIAGQPEKAVGVIKDFTYLTLKKRGKAIIKTGDVMKQLWHWITDNIPDGDLKRDLAKAKPKDLNLNRP